MNRKRTSEITALTGSLLFAAIIFHYSGLQSTKQMFLVISAFIAGIPIAIKAFRALRMKAFSIELLVIIAASGALFIGEYTESAAVTFLFLFGSYLEARALEKTRAALKSLIDMAPLEATVVKNGENIVIPADQVEKGDRVIIRSGEKIAVDGKIITGKAFLNEAAVTGEPLQAAKTIGDKVYSGTIVDNGIIEVAAERVGDDTTFAKMIELVEEAQETKTATQKFLEKFASVYTPSIIILSVIVFTLTKNIELTLTFLVIACPGALIISAPVSIVAGIGNGARNGILIKGGEAMEALAKVDIVVFDKTGTLTKGKPEVVDIYTIDMDKKDFLKVIAEAETISEHHLGQTIVKEAKKQGILLTNKPHDAEIMTGNGISARIGGRQLIIGNRNLLVQYKINLNSHALSYADGQERSGNTAIFAAIDGKIAGIISIADQIRPEAQKAIWQLRLSGIKKIIMLTGDNQHAAKLVGSRLGFDEVHAELLPEEKVMTIKKLKSEGYRVAMAGDGINDAPSIATADVGLAMGESGADLSMETADIVLMADKLDQLSYAYTLAKATIRNMKQNTLFALGTVIFLLGGILAQKVILSSGMFIHELSVLLVILNAIRLLRYNKKEEKRNGSIWTGLRGKEHAA